MEGSPPICKTARMSLSHMSLESYHMNGTIESDSQNGIIPWRCMVMGSYHGDGVISWKENCTIPCEGNQTMKTKPYYRNWIIPYHESNFPDKIQMWIEIYSITPKSPQPSHSWTALIVHFCILLKLAHRTLFCLEFAPWNLAWTKIGVLQESCRWFKWESRDGQQHQSYP